MFRGLWMQFQRAILAQLHCFAQKGRHRQSEGGRRKRRAHLQRLVKGTDIIGPWATCTYYTAPHNTTARPQGYVRGALLQFMGFAPDGREITFVPARRSGPPVDSGPGGA